MHAFILALLATGVAAFGSLPIPGNPCMDPKDFVPTNSLDLPHCEEGDVVQATQAACEAAGCKWEWNEGKDDSCECGSEQLCESAAVGGTWTPRSLTCGLLLTTWHSWTCASDAGQMDYFAGGCCSGGAAASKCACDTPADCAFNPCMDPNDFVPANLISSDHCEGDEPSNPIAATPAACEAAGCNWDGDNNDDPCHCDSEQVCESAAVGGTWKPRSFTCGGGTYQGHASSWTCASNAGEMDGIAGLCCSGGAAASKCICDTPDCAFNPCMDPNDFVPTNLVSTYHCEGDEPPNPVAATPAACEAAGCNWDGGNNDDPCQCDYQQFCESPAVNGTWTPRSFMCGGGTIQGGGDAWWTCERLAIMGSSEMEAAVGPCCSSGAVQLPTNCA